MVKKYLFVKPRKILTMQPCGPHAYGKSIRRGKGKAALEGAPGRNRAVLSSRAFAPLHRNWLHDPIRTCHKVYESTGNGPDITALHDVNLHSAKGEFILLGIPAQAKARF